MHVSTLTTLKHLKFKSKENYQNIRRSVDIIFKTHVS